MKSLKEVLMQRDGMTSEEADEFIAELRERVTYLGINAGNLDLGVNNTFIGLAAGRNNNGNNNSGSGPVS